MAKNVVTRTCIGCGQGKPKQELIRVCHTPEDTWELDATGRKNGRGAYICKSKACMEQAIKKKALDRSFAMSVPKEVYEELLKEMQNYEEG